MGVQLSHKHTLISIFHKEAIGVKFHSSSHKATFIFYSEHFN